MLIIRHWDTAFTGLRCGVAFANGIGSVEGELSQEQKFHFARWGFGVTDTNAAPASDAPGGALDNDTTNDPNAATPDGGGRKGRSHTKA